LMAGSGEQVADGLDDRIWAVDGHGAVPGAAGDAALAPADRASQRRV
jgi:hypothetical protein